MTWSEVEQGIFQRTIGQNEKFIKLIGDRAHVLDREQWSVTAQAAFKLRQPIEPADLERSCRNAWKCLRFEHPSIASTATEDFLNYSVPDKGCLDEWMLRTFFTHEQGNSAEDLIADLKPSRFTTAHLLLDESAIVLHFAHWRTDAYGAFLLVNAFLRQLACILDEGLEADLKGERLPWGEEAPRLVPSVEEALDLPTQSTDEIVDVAKSYLGKAALLRGAVGLKMDHDSEQGTTPKGTRSQCITLSESTTDAVLEAAKIREISLFSAIHASCAAATYAGAAPQDQTKPYTSTMRFSLRPHLTTSLDGDRLAAGLYTGGYMFQVPASQTWLENACQYHSEYETGVTPQFLQSRRQYADEVLRVFQQQPPPSPPISSEIDISTVEDAEKLVSRCHYGSDHSTEVLKVLDIKIGVETLSRQMYCFAWVFRGQLQLNLVYNEAFYEASTTSSMLCRLRDVLLAELGVHA